MKDNSHIVIEVRCMHLNCSLFIDRQNDKGNNCFQVLNTIDYKHITSNAVYKLLK